MATQLRECVALEHLELKVMHKYQNFLGYKCQKNERGTRESLEKHDNEMLKFESTPMPKPNHGLASKLLKKLKFEPYSL